MRVEILQKYVALFAVFSVLSLGFVSEAPAQSRPQRPKTTNQKKNNRPQPKTPEQIQKEKEAAEQAEEDRNAIIDDEVLVIDTKIVSVDTVVYEKKSGRIVTGLTRENFAVFEEGKEQEITAFSMPDAPITVTLVLEYSKWSELFGSASGGGRFEPGHYEAIRPVAQYVSNFIKPPNDYASVVAFDMRPTPITDFTNDPNRFRQTVSLLLRNRPAFRENNLFDAMKFALIGGKADSVVLEESKERKSEYAGMVDVKTGRRAIILVASGIDTFSKTNYDEIKSLVEQSGIPFFIISTANLFYKKYEHLLGPTDSLTGVPGRLTFLQARNQMNHFAKTSGGAHFEMTFPGEIPGILQSIDALMRNQYSIGYDANDGLKPGKKYKLKVMVDVNGDGKYDNKQFEVKHRPYFRTPKEKKKKKKKKK
ncbi:MAG: VWA domain-containing protein [Pyrinomonadaceae bacterium]|nr:VWA domain-containing protein [Pyrinomonadaceae bacterium]